MNCPACGKSLDSAARYCGGCGIPIVQDVARQRKESNETAVQVAQAGRPKKLLVKDSQDAETQSWTKPACDLQFELRNLAEQLQHFDLIAVMLDAISVLALGPSPEPHLTLVIGEKARGKSTVVNRLLRATVLPVGARGIRKCVKIRPGASWLGFASETDLREVASGLPLAGSLEYTLVEGPAEILKHTAILDTPGMNDSDEKFDDTIIKEAIRADVILVVLSATQLLSEQERLMIRYRLLPIAGGDIILVVTFSDKIESDQDLNELKHRVTKFVQRMPGRRLAALFLPGGDATSPVDELEKLLIVSSGRRASDREASWGRSISVLMTALLEAISALPPIDDSTQNKSEIPLLENLLKIVDREHRLALNETEAFIKSRLAQLRTVLPERLGQISSEALQREGLAQFIGETQEIAKEAGVFFVKALERGLLSNVPHSIKASASGLSSIPSDQLTDSPLLLGTEVHVGTEKQRDLKPLALTGLGALMITAGSMMPMVGGALAIFMAYRIKKANVEEYEKKLRTDTANTIRKWLDDVEIDVLAQLSNAALPVRKELHDRVKSVVNPQPKKPTKSQPNREDVEAKIQLCLKMAQDIQGGAE